jgi:hypothetical protein
MSQEVPESHLKFLRKLQPMTTSTPTAVKSSASVSTFSIPNPRSRDGKEEM